MTPAGRGAAPIGVTMDGTIFALQRRGGVSRYVTQLAAALHRRGDVDVAIDALAGHPARVDLGVPGRRRSVGSWCPTSLRAAASVFRDRLAPPVPAERVYHPTYFVRSRRRHNAPLVVTVFDLIPEVIGASEAAVRFPSWLRRNAARSADVCLCISQRTARDVQERFQVPADRIVVTPLASSLPVPSLVRPAARPFILFVGNRSGYKNWRLLQQAYESTPAVHRDVELVCVGGPPLLPSERPRHGRVRHVQVDDPGLAMLYATATALVYPSRYEGFGLPVLEAMAAGCPVVTTRGGAIPEVGGDVVHYVEPDRPEALAQALLMVLAEGRSAPMVAAAQERAGQFSWDITASLTVAAYARALGLDAPTR